MRPMDQGQIAVLGLAVMGANLALNLRDHGYKVVLWNRSPQKTEELAKQGGMIPCKELKELVERLERPRKLLLMVQADAVDGLLENLMPLLEAGDCVIDGGNSHYAATERRCKLLESKGLLYVGTGVSGGEEGARHGPAIMPGGSKAAWPMLKPILQSISAHVGKEPCCDWVGSGGSGHCVKMVHNGIEYAEMQMIAEAYQMLRYGLGLDLEATQRVFAKWNEGPLQSFLIEITAEILKVREADGVPLVDRILDAAQQKGTGRWTVEAALEIGAPVTLIAEAVFGRVTSSLKELRVRMAQLSPKASRAVKSDPASIEKALYGAKILTYVQGIDLIARMGKQYQWNLDLAAAIRLWRGGCIIRGALLEPVAAATKQEFLLYDDTLRHAVEGCDASWRQVVAEAALSGIPAPCLSAGLMAWDSLRSAQLPANLIQAQRDYFGAHTFERTDAPRGKTFHHSWYANT
jgi:6-phosphogluconate dehydrogenase